MSVLGAGTVGPFHAYMERGEWIMTLRACWNAFCVAEDDSRHPDPFFDSHHVDRTGYSWTQAPGTEYCAGCHGYVDTSRCGHTSIVTTIYEREF